MTSDVHWKILCGLETVQRILDSLSGCKDRQQRLDKIFKFGALDDAIDTLTHHEDETNYRAQMKREKIPIERQLPKKTLINVLDNAIIEGMLKCSKTTV